MEKLGVQAVVLVTRRFEGLARSVIRARGADPGVMIVLPETEQTEFGETSAVVAIADQALQEALARIAPAALVEAPAARSEI
jgi:hypothetical protein